MILWLLWAFSAINSVLPSITAGDGGKLLAVNAGETGTEWVDNVVRTTGNQNITGSKAFSNMIIRYNTGIDYFDNNTADDWFLTYRDRNGHDMLIFAMVKNANKSIGLKVYVRNSNNTWKDVMLAQGN